MEEPLLIVLGASRLFNRIQSEQSALARERDLLAVTVESRAGPTHKTQALAPGSWAPQTLESSSWKTKT